MDDIYAEHLENADFKTSGSEIRGPFGPTLVLILPKTKINRIKRVNEQFYGVFSTYLSRRSILCFSAVPLRINRFIFGVLSSGVIR